MKTKLKYILIVILSLLLWCTLSAQTTNFVVTNVNNSGTGSLRQAVINAMTVNAPTTVTFRIPAASGNVINLTSEIPMRSVSRTITINGFNQSTGTNNIILRGSGTQSINCFNDSTVNLTVYGLQFENFSYAIRAFSNATYLTNTTIGGTGTNGNVFIKNYVAIGTNGGTTITGNYIGTDRNFTAGVGNTYAIYTTTPYYSDYNGNPITVNNNYICSAYVGVYLNPPAGNNPNPLLLMNNNIVGTNNAAATRTDLANTYSIYTNAATANAFLQGNTIAYTTHATGMTFGGFEFVNNSFYCNAQPINNLKSPYLLPIISQITPNQNGTVTISGTSNKPNDVLNIFQKDSSACTTLPCQGFFAGTTTANANRQWTITLSLIPGKIITVNSTSGGTNYTPIGRIAAYSIGSSSLFTTCYTIPCPTVNISFATTKNNLCYGNREGTAQLTISPVGTGGTYAYQIINAANNTVVTKGAITATVSIGQLPAGTYQAIVTNSATSCSYTSSKITITQPAAPLSTVSCKESTPVSTSTSSDAVAQVVVSGGTLPYSLTITRPTGANFTLGPQTSGTFNIPNLAPGNYNVTAFDANYATGNPQTACTATCIFTINTANCTALKVSVKTTNNVLCYGGATGNLVIKYADIANNLPLTLSASNGFSQTITAFSSDSTAVIPNLRAGSYTITLRNRLNCTTTTTATLTEPPALTVTCDSVADAKRVGEASGRASLTLRGGTAAYTLVISGAMNRNYNRTTPSTLTIDSLKKGVYIATVYDNYQCFDTCQFTINEPTCTGFAVRATTDSIRCFGEKNGTITLTTLNGLEPFNYTWSNTAIGNQDIADNLDIGTYKATVTDDRNCKDSVTATVRTPSVLTTNINKTEVTTVGGANGRISVTVSGGTPSFEVNLSLNNTTIVLTSQTGNTFTFNNLSKGTYIALTTDAHSCSKTDTIRINDPNCNFIITGQADSVSCYGGNNGKIMISHNAPGVGVNYVWSDTNISNTATATGLKSGIYSVTATTIQNCSDTLSIEVFQPDSLEVSAFPNDVTVVGGANGSIQVNVVGGTQPYRVMRGNIAATRLTERSFVFNNLSKGTYTFTVTDAKGCSKSQTLTINDPVCNMVIDSQIDSVTCKGSATGRIILTVNNSVGTPIFTWTPPSVSNSNIANNLTAGTYSVTVTDSRRCTVSTTLRVFEPTALTSTHAVVDVTTVNGSNGRITVVVKGGIKPYVVKRDSTAATSNNDSTFVFNNLTSGNYTYTVTDANGCTTSQTVTVGSPNCNMTISAQVVNVLCKNGATGRITLTINNSIGTPIFAWSPPSVSSSNIANNLTSGTYAVTATDSRRCTIDTIIRVSEPNLPLSAVHIATPVSTLGGSDGKIDVTVRGGTSPYTVVRGTTAATRLTDSTFVFNSLTSGNYTYTVTDANGCNTSQTVTVGSPNCNMTISAQVVNVLCKNGATGRITLTVNNSVGTPIFAWSPPSVSSSNIANNLTAGTYVVTATDSRRCTIDTIIRVSEPNLPLSAVHIATPVSTLGGSDGKIDVTVRGGTSPYTVVRGTTAATRLTDSTFVFNGLTTGNYTYTVTDANGCTTSQTVTVGSPNCNITADITITQAISCFGASDGRLNVVVQNAQTPQYRWLPDLGNTQNPRDLAAGTYAVTVMDARGCTATAQRPLTQPSQIFASLLGDTAVCGGQSARLRFSVQNSTTFTLTFTDGRDTFQNTTLEKIVTPTISTTYRLFRVQSGVCTGSISDNNRTVVTVTTPSLPTGLKAEKDSLCAGSDIHLTLNATSSNQYIWQTPLGEQTTTIPQLVITNVKAANSGNYTVKTMQNGCLSAAATPIVVRVITVPNEKANAGLDKIECEQAASTLNATPIAAQNITGRWLVVTNGVLTNPTNNVTTVSNLTIGAHAFVWILSNAVCGEVSRDTVVISVSTKPELATTQQINLDSKLSTLLINTRELLKNKILDPSVFNIKILKFPDKTTVETRSNGIYFNRNDLFEAQTIEIEFEICAKICPTVCTKGKILIVLRAMNDETDFTVPKVFATNSSGGSSLEINGLDFFLDNEITIVNRWGGAVFGPTVYKNNTPEKSWDGRKNGNLLPTGAYYYFIRYKNKDVLKIKKGIIYLIEEL